MYGIVITSLLIEAAAASGLPFRLDLLPFQPLGTPADDPNCERIIGRALVSRAVLPPQISHYPTSKSDDLQAGPVMIERLRFGGPQYPSHCTWRCGNEDVRVNGDRWGSKGEMSELFLPSSCLSPSASSENAKQSSDENAGEKMLA